MLFWIVYRRELLEISSVSIALTAVELSASFQHCFPNFLCPPLGKVWNESLHCWHRWLALQWTFREIAETEPRNDETRILVLKIFACDCKIAKYRIHTINLFPCFNVISACSAVDKSSCRPFTRFGIVLWILLWGSSYTYDFFLVMGLFLEIPFSFAQNNYYISTFIAKQIKHWGYIWICISW